MLLSWYIRFLSGQPLFNPTCYRPINQRNSNHPTPSQSQNLDDHYHYLSLDVIRYYHRLKATKCDRINTNDTFVNQDATGPPRKIIKWLLEVSVRVRTGMFYWILLSFNLKEIKLRPHQNKTKCQTKFLVSFLVSNLISRKFISF